MVLLGTKVLGASIMLSVFKHLTSLFPFFLSHFEKKTQKKFLIALLLIGLSIFLNIKVPVVFKKIVDNLSHDFSTTSWKNTLLLSSYGLLWLLACFSEKIREIVMYPVIAQCVTIYSLEIFHNMHSQSLEYHCEKKTGTIIETLYKSQLSLITACMSLFFKIIPFFIETVFVFIILGHYVNFFVGMIILITLIGYLMTHFFIMRFFRAIDQDYQNSDSLVDARILDSFINIENIKFLCSDRFETKSISSLIGQRDRSMIRLLWCGTLSSIVQNIILGLSLAVISTITGHLVVQDVFSIGDFILVNSYLILLFTPLDQLAQALRGLVSACKDLKNSNELLFETTTSFPNPNELSPCNLDAKSIDMISVSFAYQKPYKNVLHHFNLSIPQSSTTAIVGPTGAGKSTLSRLLLKLYECDSGAIRLGNSEIKNLSIDCVRKIIAIVPQEAGIFNRTLKENLTYGSPQASLEELNNLIEATQLKDLVASLPYGLQTLLGENGVKLSGGEKQRIAIIRALLRHPNIIIFDEATSNLDPQTEQDFLKIIEQLPKEITIIMIAHRLSTITHADKIFVVDLGQIIEEGSHQQLLDKQGLYYNLWEQQSAK